MTVEPEANTTSALDPRTRVLLPEGMVGLPDTTEFELVATEESLPIMWLRSTGEERLSFPVVEPGQFVPDYKLELNDADAAFLDDSSVPLVLTVLTVRSLTPQKATINLVGPIVINRQTLKGKQVLLANSERYSVAHPIIDETAPATVGSC
jgi:flagellar assembly factor FliW